MKGLRTAGVVALLGAALLVPTGTSSAANCGDLGSIDRIVTSGDVSCSRAKAVAKRWKRLCNYSGRCQVEGGGTGEQWVCKGRRMKCTGRESNATVTFTP